MDTRTADTEGRRGGGPKPRLWRSAVVIGSLTLMSAPVAVATGHHGWSVRGHRSHRMTHRHNRPAHRKALEPCDIYAAAGTPCVAAFSSTRALFASYDGPLYQVRRASDGATMNVGLLRRGGYANALAQDTFCADTSCAFKGAELHKGLVIFKYSPGSLT